MTYEFQSKNNFILILLNKKKSKKSKEKISETNFGCLKKIKWDKSFYIVWLNKKKKNFPFQCNRRFAIQWHNAFHWALMGEKHFPLNIQNLQLSGTPFNEHLKTENLSLSNSELFMTLLFVFYILELSMGILAWRGIFFSKCSMESKNFNKRSYPRKLKGKYTFLNELESVLFLIAQW